MAISQGAGTGHDSTSAQSSDSNRWLLAQEKLRESGIPPAHERLWTTPTVAAEADEHMEAALAEGTRAEANLGALLRGLTHLTAGAGAARDANITLLAELDKLRELLGRSNECELGLRLRVQALEAALESVERDAELSRLYLIHQEDLFLVELLTDHEREIADLKRRLDEVEEAGRRAERRDSNAAPAPISTMPPPPDFHAETALELEPISTMPPPPSLAPHEPFLYVATPPPRSSHARPIATLVLRTIAIGPEPIVRKDAATDPPHEEPAPPTSRAPMPSVLPGESVETKVEDASLEEVGAVVLADDDAAPAEEATFTEVNDAPPSHRDSTPIWKQKPDPSTRPLSSYSLGSGEVAEEVIDTSRLGSRHDKD